MYTTKEKEYQVILADDHPVFTLGLHTLLNTMPDFTVVGQSHDGLQALDQIKAYQPEIAVLDNDMPGMTGIELAQYIGKHKLKTRAVILTYHIDADLLSKLKHIGVWGIMMKQSALDEMSDCLQEVAIGKKYISSTCKAYVNNPSLQAASTADQKKIEGLTNAEISVLRLIADNMSTQNIAETMFVSPRPLKTTAITFVRS